MASCFHSAKSLRSPICLFVCYLQLNNMNTLWNSHCLWSICSQQDGYNSFCLSLIAENIVYFLLTKHCKMKCSQTCLSLLIVAIKLTLMEISDRGSRYCLALGNTEHLIMHWSIIIIFILFCDFHCYCSLIACARIRRILEWCSSCWYQYCRWRWKTHHYADRRDSLLKTCHYHYYHANLVW